MNIGKISGGTHAGWRIVRLKGSDWTCPVRDGGCGKSIKYFWTKCPNCGHPRPEQ